MKIRFLGKKDNYRDSIPGVGLTWQAGEIKNVTPQLADRLMVFPDMWEILRGNVLGKKSTAAAKAEAKVPEKDLIDVAPPPSLDTTMPVVNFSVMKAEDVVQFMRRNYNVDLNTNKPLQELRQDALEEFTRKENELMDEKEERERRDRERAETEKEELEAKEKAEKEKAKPKKK